MSIAASWQMREGTPSADKTPKKPCKGQSTIFGHPTNTFSLIKVLLSNNWVFTELTWLAEAKVSIERLLAKKRTPYVGVLFTDSSAVFGLLIRFVSG